MNSKLIVVAGGTGRLGRLIVNALLDHPEATVRVLVRDPAKPEAAALASDRVQLHRFDFTQADAAARAAAVDGAFAVVSAVQGGPDLIVDAQLALLRAAKAAGARRFIPSSYSFDFFALPQGVNVNADWRRTLAVRARDEVTDAFEVVHVLQGMFADRGVLGFLGIFDGEVLRYWGDGKTPIDWTTWEDTARFTAAAALDDRRVPERLFVSGDRADVFRFAALWHEVNGTELHLQRLGTLDDLAQETQRRLAASPRDMFQWLPLMYARGLFGGDALLGPSENARYPEIHAEDLRTAITRGL